MPVVNAAVREQLQTAGKLPSIINLAALGLDRAPAVRLGRLPRVLGGLARLTVKYGLRKGSLYISVSGGIGQLYEIAFVAIARLRGMKVFLHHHSFAYLDAPSRLTAVLTRVAGDSAVHVTQSPAMAVRLATIYGAQRVVPISNAVFLLRKEECNKQNSKQFRTLGFISNIVPEKGVFEFLDLMAAMQQTGRPVQAKLAGPFQDARTERQVRGRLTDLPSVEYVGPKYGIEKGRFFADIDVLVFPTRYANETEGIVNHEAMSRGIPVIAYGRGCIPEIVSADCGLVIDPAEPFVPAALAKLESWLADPVAFQAASQASAARFARTYDENAARWRALLEDIVGAHPGGEPRQGVES